ncbi:hypothetical protein BKA81DRAFT_112807 [Phyllosticta paracitricarpa]|uniref:DUF427 domain-containing protein n=1 Tax=Phyllosticta paracitricarpa TaxID=2016321 RepID=A0ABR1MXG2_9PEZI
MVSVLGNKDLIALARHLISKGPVKTLPSSRRIRILLNGTYIADTTQALYVWEHDRFPQYYVPLSSFKKDSWTKTESIDNDAASLLRITAGNQSTERVIAFSTSLDKDGDKSDLIHALRGLVRVEFSSVDQWYEEDTPIYVHPKDPFKRVDIVHSTRPICVLVDGVQVAAATSSQHLFETTLPTRFYLPPTAVDAALLRPSNLVTRCPYKGDAEYYDVVVGGGERVLRDVVWYYKHPTLECSPIAGHLCFYNEKVDIELDGKLLERPVIKFA